MIALTNNFARVDVPPEELEFLGWGDGVIPGHLRNLFDDFCDSSALGMRWVLLMTARTRADAEIMEQKARTGVLSDCMQTK